MVLFIIVATCTCMYNDSTVNKEIVAGKIIYRFAIISSIHNDFCRACIQHREQAEV